MGTWSMSGGYDTLNRLTSASATSGVYQGLSATWTVDSFGNRTSENFSGTLTSPNAPPIPASTSAGYNAGNQVQAASGMAPRCLNPRRDAAPREPNLSGRSHLGTGDVEPAHHQ